MTILCLLQVRFVVAQNFGDWSAFQSAGATAGSRALLDPLLHTAWQTTHHVPHSTFPYLPGAAWVLVPLAQLPPAEGYAFNFLLMACAALFAALTAAKVFAVRKDVAVVSVFAWAPLVAGLATGQNAPLGLLLVTLAARGLAARSWLLTGVACGALLYKPLYGVPLLLLLVLRREWRACGVAAACTLLWYLASVSATAGDLLWPSHYAAAIGGYALHDFQVNALKAIGIPQILMRAGLQPVTAYAAGLALFVFSLPLIVRLDAARAVALVMLASLAFGPHTQPYDLALALPAIWCYLREASNAFTRAAIAAMYAAAPLWLLSGVFRFDVLAPICIAFAMAALYDARPLRRNRSNAASV